MRPLSLFNQTKDRTFGEILAQALNLIDSSKYFKEVTRFACFPDEPQFWKYEVKFFSKNNRKKVRYSGGFAWQREKALIKALGEAMERFCLASFNEADFKVASYADLKNKERALEPSEVVGFSQKQRQELGQKYFFDKKSRFKWVRGYSLASFQPVWIPAQLVFVPYKIKDEPMIIRPISTGAACWRSLAGAVYRGIGEAIERDAYMITYLNKLPRARINIADSQNPVLAEIDRAFKRYNLELAVIETTTDISMPAVTAIVIDKTGIGPAVSVGLSASLKPKEVVIKAISEAQHIRDWIRGKMNDKLYKKIVSQKTIKKTGERTILWSKKENIKRLEFLIRNSSSKSLSEIKDYSANNTVGNLKTALSLLKKANLEAFYVDITQPEIEKAGFKVVKVAIPKLQPLYILEPPAYYGGKRLYQVPKILGYTKKETKKEDLNDFPHPFH